MKRKTREEERDRGIKIKTKRNDVIVRRIGKYQGKFNIPALSSRSHSS